MPDKKELNKLIDPNIPVDTGLIEGDDPRDLLGADLVINWELIPEKLPTPKTTINQGKEWKTRNSCTMAGALIQVGQLYDFKVDDQLLGELCDYAIEEEGRDIDGGRFVSVGCNCVRKFVKKKFGYEVVYASYRDDDEEYLERNRRGGLTGIGYRSCAKYTMDYMDDGVIQGDGKDWTIRIGGHRTNNYQDGVLDSYYGRKARNGEDNNEYEVKHPEKIRANGVYFPGMYIFFKKEWVNNNYEEILKRKKEVLQIDAFVNYGSLIWKFLNKPEYKNERIQLEQLVSSIRTKFGFTKLENEDEKENRVLLGVLQKIKDKEIVNTQISEMMKQIVK